MRTIINKEEMRREWVIEKWYEKTMYVFGAFMTGWMVAAFIVGFIMGMMGV